MTPPPDQSLEEPSERQAFDDWLRHSGHLERLFTNHGAQVAELGAELAWLAWQESAHPWLSMSPRTQV
jgi:hypothetical protein